ncbi:MAG: hypothetical protein L0211_09820 [Planctomycetaceae bacterium]|nr:hypothetical protein [Planctomycetaceae bacterium]
MFRDRSSDKMQLAVCRRHGAEPMPALDDEKVGISANVKEGVVPLNALRIRPEGGTTGWYIWGGQWSDDPDFFLPLHVAHLSEWCPQIVPYLLLPPGWRVLLAPGHEDIWFDESLLTPRR